jgi:DNA-directed RNA polymerase subunit N (RpoN/RPB10)
MIYIKCPSCGLLLGNRQMVYEKGLDEINSNPNTDDEKKLELKTKLIESLDIKRYCCKMRVMTYINMTEIIH